MVSPSDLSLDYNPSSYPVTQKPFGDQPDQTQNLEEFLARLEEERLKIEAFKRELPLCMQLLNNAMETYRQQLEAYQANQAGPRPVLEEFIPLENMSIDGSEKAPNAPSEKANWMVSAQLWSPSPSPASEVAKQQPLTVGPIREAEQPFSVSPKLAPNTKQRNGGAFLPFTKDKSKSSSSAPRVLPELALASSEKEMEEKKCSELESGGMGARRDNCSKGGGASGAAEQGKGGTNPTEGQPVTQTHRKARRCWSPDLHRRFVNALQILGGSQVATPKQIRELMKVDGLTNDEVKSHLQKYRLHTRRPIPAPQATAGAAAQLVVLGGIWVPSEYAGAAGPAIYGGHPATAHYCAPPMMQDFYPAPPPPHPHHHHLHPPPLHRSAAPSAAYKGTIGSPESDLRSVGERSEIEEGTEEGEEEDMEEEEETEEEDKSEGGNWNGKEKALVPAGGKAEGSNGTDVALKF